MTYRTSLCGSGGCHLPGHHGTSHGHSGRSGSEDSLSKHCLLRCLFKWWCGKASSCFVVGSGGVASLLGKDVKL